MNPSRLGAVKSGASAPRKGGLRGYIEAFYTLFFKIFEVLLYGINYIVFFVVLVLRIITSVLNLIILYIPKLVGHFVPKRISLKMSQVLVYSGVNLTAEEIIGMTLVYSVVVSVIVYLISQIMQLSPSYRIIASLIAFLCVWIFPKILLDALIYRRTQNIESVLPDILDIIAQNIKAGMTIDRALWSAARPEFGPMANELQSAARVTLTGTPLPDALIGLTNRILSERLERTIRLVIQGITSGGELPTILQTIATDMRSEQNLLKQMKSETNAHVMFILFAILIGAPLLFAVSLQFINVFSSLFSKIDLDKLSDLPKGAAPVMMHPFTISSVFYLKYSIITLFVLCFFGSFLIGLLRTGKPISGLQNIPQLVLISISIFLILNYVLTSFFSSAFVI
jgi:hypothetical protein